MVREAVTDAFDQIDDDQSGKLTMAEVELWLRAYGPLAAASAIARDEGIAGAPRQLTPGAVPPPLLLPPQLWRGRAVADYVAKGPRELTLHCGDGVLIDVNAESSTTGGEGGGRGGEGPIPMVTVTLVSEARAGLVPLGSFALEGGAATMLSDFVGEGAGELAEAYESDLVTLLAGRENEMDEMNQINQTEGGWLLVAREVGGSERAAVGFVPSAFVQPLDPPTVLSPEDETRERRRRRAAATRLQALARGQEGRREARRRQRGREAAEREAAATALQARVRGRQARFDRTAGASRETAADRIAMVEKARQEKERREQARKNRERRDEEERAARRELEVAAARADERERIDRETSFGANTPPILSPEEGR